MRFEPRHAFQSLRSGAAPRELPRDIAFLSLFYGDRAAWDAAAAEAAHLNVCAARVLMMSGAVSPTIYYLALARHLGLPFIGGWTPISSGSNVASAFARRCVRLHPSGPARWLVAPTDHEVHTLLAARRLGIALPDVAITSPSWFATILERRAQEGIEHVARERLPAAEPRLSAKSTGAERTAGAAMLASLLGVAGLLVGFRMVCDVFAILFLASITLRLCICASARTPAVPPALGDAELPVYSVLVPLRGEAGMVADIVAALGRLDYPRSKLDILFLVEREDAQTRAALGSAIVPPWCRIVVGPADTRLRTKPRALNIGLLAARGTLATVFDAEDQPEPDQLRQAAARFAASPDSLACLQARLAISNGDEGLLARLFAIEYAVLFDLFNVGMGALRLPLALGGTSNHFRVASLRAVGGWDAWNVTEDADLGLRLARFGFEVGTLASTTWETAPDKLGIWMKQRRRWTKGWIQTFLVLLCDAPRVMRQLGWRNSGALAFLLLNLVVGPLMFPVFMARTLYDLSETGFVPPQGTGAIVEATLGVCVPALAVLATLGTGYAGLRARRCERFLKSLPLMLPYQLMIGVAAWMGALDLVRNPYRWHKTPHQAQRAAFTRSSPAAPPPPRKGSRRSPRG